MGSLTSQVVGGSFLAAVKAILTNADRPLHPRETTERALAETFAFLGFAARHLGGAGQTDIILDAPVTGTPYRVVDA